MPETRECPQCGRALPPDAPSGLCPECLLRGDSDDNMPLPTPQPASFVPPEPQELAAYFPQLEILELLGKGGMGAVYKARQPHLDRLVALKILPLEIGQDPAFTERFTREARALARLSHPNIVGVYDFGEVRASAVLAPGGEPGQENASEQRQSGSEPALYYFLMEYVDGTNLRQLIAGGGLKPDEALAIVPQICEALQFAHDEGIVHRDIKPENVLVDTRGRVKIADFGLAKLLGRAPAGLSLTATRQVMGTWHYMAPEQMQGSGAVDHRADIYSLGVVFYEMLTGDVPAGRFDPPSRKVQLDVRLDDVVLKALEQEPERRFQAASEVKTEVETISRTAPPAVPSPRPQDVAAEHARIEAARRRMWAPAVGLAIVGILNCLVPFLIGVAVLVEDGPPAVMVGPPGPAEILLLSFIWLPIAVLILLGALKMKNLQAYGLAVTATVLAMLPCTPVFFAGLPVGICVLVVLTRPDVKSAFETTAGVRNQAESVFDSAGERQARSTVKGPGVGQLSAGPLESARRQVRGPANGLLAAGALNGLMPCLTLVAFASAESSAESAASVSGGSHSVAFVAGPSVAEIVILAFIWLPVTVLVLLGAVKMKSLQAYALAVTAAVLAMLPCAPGFFIGLPLGIWALVVLTRPDVKAAFAATAGAEPKGEEISDAAGDGQARSMVKGPAVGLLSVGLLECALMVVLVCGGLVTGYWMLARQAVQVEQARQIAQKQRQDALREAHEQQQRAEAMRSREMQSRPSVPSSGASQPEDENAISSSDETNRGAPAAAGSSGGGATMHRTPAMGVLLLPLFLLVAGLFLCRVVTIICAVRLMRGESYGAGVVGSLLALIPCSPLWIASVPVGIWGLVVLNRDDVKQALRGKSGRKPASAPPPAERQSPRVRSQVRRAHETDSRISEQRSRADEAAAAVHAGRAPRAPMPLLLLVAVFFVVSGLTIAAGAALGVYAFLTQPVGSHAFWGWMGGAIGCLVGGAGSLVGCWNSYRQMEGAGDILREPGWTWLDWLLLLYGIGGAGIMAEVFVDGSRLSEPTVHSGLTLGGLMLGQALLYAVVRGLTHRSVALEANAARQGQRPNPEAVVDSANELPSSEAQARDDAPLPGISTILDRQVEAAAAAVRTVSFWRTTVKAVLLVVYVLGLLAFFGWQGAGRAEEFRHTVGFPTPWFVVEKDSGGFRWEITLESWAWLVAGATFAAYYLYWRIKLAEGTASRGCGRPEIHILLWCVLAIMAIAVSLFPLWFTV